MHVANLSFISKIIEKAIATQIHDHLKNNDIVDNIQSAYKAGHSCETALLRVYNDIVTTIGRGYCAMLVLLDFSAAFDTIDHDNLFCIIEKCVGICGNALKLIKSYFSNRTQRIQIDDVLSYVANYYVWCSPWIGFRTLLILFVLIANERDYEVS